MRLPGPRDDGRRAGRSRRHRQGLRGGPDGGTARGVGPRTSRSSTAASAPSSRSSRPRARRLAADAERSRRAVAGALALSVRQTALSASGVRKGDHILDRAPACPCAGGSPPGSRCHAAGEADAAGCPSGPRAQARAAAVADALTTAFMVLSVDEIAALVRAQSRARGVDPSGRSGARGPAPLRRSRGARGTAPSSRGRTG